MNNMQKAFKRKATRGLADGGLPSPHMLGTGMAANAGIALARRPQQIETAIEAATGTTPSSPSGYGGGGGGLSARRDNAVPPAHMLAAQRRGLADGGEPKRKPHGGEIEGPGGPTDDMAGEFKLSAKEYVLPADTVDALGGPEVLDEVRDATHEFVDEENRPRGLANGGYIDAAGRKIGELGSRLKGAVSGLRGGAPAPAAPIAAPAIPAAPKVSSGGFTNAQRVAATPKGYATGGLAKAPSKALSLAKGVGTKVAAPLAVASAIGDSAAEDSTARYAKRFGVSEPTGDGSAGDLLKFAGLRAGGFASDLGNTLTLGAAGKLYRDRPGDTPASAPTAAPPAAAPTAAAPAAPTAPVNAEDQRVSQELLNRGVSMADQGDSRFTYQDAQASSMRRDAGIGALKNYKLGGTEQYDNGNADIYATSTRKDGKLNSFTGVGNGNRPNWEQRNPADHQAAVERADKMKSDVVSIAVNYATQGDREGAYRMAAGDPAATAAVEQAFQQRELRQAALNGNKEAGEILRQQAAGDASRDVAAINADGNYRTGLAKAKADMMKAAQDQKNSDRDFGLKQNADTRAGGKQRRDEIDAKLQGVFGPQVDKDGVLNPAYAEFKAAIDETLLGRTIDGTPDGKQATLEDLGDQQLEKYAQDFAAYKRDNPGAVRGFVDWLMGNEVAPTNNLDDMAAQPGSAEEGFFNDTYRTADGRTRYMNDKTLPGLRRAGFLPQGSR